MAIWIDVLVFYRIGCRFITLFPTGATTLDLRTLRAVRVLRPLKLVSGVPSTYIVYVIYVKFQ